VVGDALLGNAFLQERLAIAAQGVERVEAQRDLVDRIVRQLLRSAVEQHELVMALGVLGHEGDARAGAADAAVADHVAHDAGVEIDHAVEVGGVDAEVGELGAERHGFSLRPKEKGVAVSRDAFLPGAAWLQAASLCQA